MIGKPQARAPQTMSEELFIRVNDVIELANKTGRRYDSTHAQTVMMHAFARYSAFHYRSTVSVDSAEEREAFVEYMVQNTTMLMRAHLEDMAGQPKVAGEEATPADPAFDTSATPGDEASE